MHHILFNIRYLDPGSGSLLVQLIAAGALGGVFIVVKVFWNKIKVLFARIKAFVTGKEYVPPQPEPVVEEVIDEQPK